METIKFLPAPLNANGTIDYNDSALKGKNGVYIAGVKIEVNDFDNPIVKASKFCPLIIGETKNLSYRLKGHQDLNSHTQSYGELNSFKEIWDLEKSPTIFYKGIEIWNQIWKTSRKKKSDPHRLLKLKELFDEIELNADKCLLWFPNPHFFDLYFSKINLMINPVSINWHLNTLQNILNYDNLFSVDSGILIGKINRVKLIIEKNFYFAYALVEDKSQLKNIENFVNEKFRYDLKLPTYAGSDKPTEKYFIDLSAIQNELVNMTSAPFKTPLELT